MHASGPRIRYDRFHPAKDDEVIVRVLAGEVDLFEILMRRYNERSYRVARAIVGPGGEPEEVMQEAYVKAFHRLHQFRGQARFSTWLTQIVVNTAKTARSRQTRHVCADPEAVMPTSSSSDSTNPERAAASRELVRLIEHAADALPERLRAVFMLREVEGLSTSEAAEALDLSEEAVRVRLHRGRRLLRDHLKQALGPVIAEAFRFYAPRCDRVVRSVLDQLD